MTHPSRRGSAPSVPPQVGVSPATALEPPSAGRMVHSVGFHARITQFMVVQPELKEHLDVSAA